MDNFKACLPVILKFEGGKSDDARDPGGRTNEGITQRTYDAWLAKQGRPHADVFGIPASDRDTIYRTEYWNVLDADHLPLGVDLVTFDLAVNSGPKRAIDIFTQIGAGKMAPLAAINAVCNERLAFLKRLGTWNVFGRAWSTRIAQCRKIAIGMTTGKVLITPPVTTPSSAAPSVAAASIGGLLVAAAPLLQYLLKDIPTSHILMTVGTGIAMLVASLVTNRKPPVLIPPTITDITTEVQKPTAVQSSKAWDYTDQSTSSFEQLKELMAQRAAIDAKIAQLQPSVKAMMDEVADLLGKIPAQPFIPNTKTGS